MNSPYGRLPLVPALTISSSSVAADGSLGPDQYSAIFGVPGGEDLSPQLTWSGAPTSTKSFVVSMYDPEAPTPSGLWHWMVADIPADTTDLAAGVIDLPGNAWTVKNDARTALYVGSAPAIHAVDHYAIVVQALDIASIREVGLDEEATPGFNSFSIVSHIVGRGVLWAVGRI